MPYPADHKAKTRARIVESARIMFNRQGFDQVSIDEIMKHAGLTRGGFYHHFENKEQLYSEAVLSFIDNSPFARKVLEHRGKPFAPKALARLLVQLYLGDEMFANPDQHCPLVALPSDVARAGLKPRKAYTRLLQGMLGVHRAAFSANDPDAERKAQLIVSLCVGGMVIARATSDATLRSQLRASARIQALALLEG